MLRLVPSRSASPYKVTNGRSDERRRLSLAVPEIALIPLGNQ